MFRLQIILIIKKEKINSLNIFPVPDGDTGTNMGMTMLSAKKEIPSMTGPLGETAAKISMALLRGGRGNSGVILSLFFRGFAKSSRRTFRRGLR